MAREELKAEGNSTRDLWPSEKECPACRDNSGWDDEAVYYFLMDYYRPLPQDGALGELAQLSELEQQQSVANYMATVRYWAAGSVAVATCGLGFILRVFSNKYKYKYVTVFHCYINIHSFSHDQIKFHCMTKQPLLLIFRPVPERP